jgi:methylthioribose-1-phosphate isomerase
MNNDKLDQARSVTWKDGKLFFLDQTRLPGEILQEEQTSSEQVWDSIKKLKVRGAPAIGIAGAYGLVLGIRDHLDLSIEKFILKTTEQADYLNSSRPTAVNLSWALKRMVTKAKTVSEDNPDTTFIFKKMIEEAVLIHEEDKVLCRGMGENGLPLIKEGMGILTHCNAGALATSELGTATAPMYLAHEKGINFSVYADETRPLLQGARLTSWELQQAGIDVTLISDNMAASMMNEGLIDMVIVGTDRVAANGDVANKIGTMGVAILAAHFDIPFYVACPSSTVDMATATGAEIEIEERGSEEITSFGERRTGPEGIKVRNPAFDVTPHRLVTGLITEKGIIRAPYKENLARLYS